MRGRQPEPTHTDRLSDDTGAFTDPVDRLLRAASAPVQPGELAGEAEALRAFRTARSAEPAMSRRPSRRRGWSRAIGVKVAAISLACAAAGVAVAASTGVLPNPITEPAGTVPAPSSRPSADPGGSTSMPAASGASTAATPAADRAALAGLCQAYIAAGDRDPGQAVGGAGLAKLVEAAAGADRIVTFCDDLLTAQASPTRTPPAHPSSGPSAHPSPSPPGGEPRPSDTGARR
jgi:hypothetical protein